MRVSPLKKNFIEYGAKFCERYGCEIVKEVQDLESEYNAISKAIGISDFSYMQKFTFPEENGIKYLSQLFSGNIEKIDYGCILNTYLLNNDGFLISDCYIIRGDGDYILLCESIANDEDIKKIINVNNVDGAKDLTDSYLLISIDGYRIKEIISDLFGEESLELPPLTAEKYCVEDVPITLLRTSKITNNGYLIMAPVEIKNQVFNTITESLQKIDGFSLCGTDVQNVLRIEENLFNIFSEGVLVKDPLLLGMKEKIDLTKKDFLGKSKIIERMKMHILTRRVIITSSSKLEKGLEIFDGDKGVGIVLSECFSPKYNKFLGLALVKSEVISEGKELSYKESGHNKIQKISILKS